jgi:hypothetical protein
MLALRLLLTLGLVTEACRGPARTALSVGGVEVRRATSEPRVRTPGVPPAQADDWVLQDTALRFVVLGEHPQGDREAGSVVQALDRADARPGPLRRLDPFVEAEGRPLVQSSPRFEAVLRQGRPALRWTARAARQDIDLEVVREYTLDPGRRALRVHTRVTNQGRAVRDVATGFVLGWGGVRPFAPGVGQEDKDFRAEAPWVGWAAEGLAMAWAAEGSGNTLRLHFTVERHDALTHPGPVEATHAPVALGPGASFNDHSALFLSPGDLATVSRAVSLARGEALGDVRVRVYGERFDSTNTPRITVATERGEAVTLADATRGLGFLSLPPGRYEAWATLPGHALSESASFEVTAGATGSVPVTLTIPKGGILRIDARDADADRPLPVRVVVRGVAPTRDPNLGPAHSGRGAGTVVIAPTGRVDIDVPPGKYAVTVSHGPEWTLDTQDVTVTETLRGEVTARLRRAVAMQAWVACDLHVHAAPSFDSQVSIEDRVASLVAEGIGFATPTEHNVVGDYTVGVALLPDSIAERLVWVPAVEVTTDRSAQPWGHFNVYPYLPTPDAPSGGPPPFLNVSPRDIFRTARANNPAAIIQVNHPRMQPNIGYFSVTGLDPQTGRAVSPEYDPGYDAIEVFNGFYVGDIPAVERHLADWFALLGTGARYVATGSSDSHNLQYQWAGYPRTYARLRDDLPRLPGDLPAAAEVLDAIRRGRVMVTSGPMLLLDAEGAGPGDHIPLAEPRPVTFHLRVEAAPWVDVSQVELWRDGARVLTLPVAPSGRPVRVDTRVPLPVQPGSFVVAIARGAARSMEVVMPWSRATPFAFTNPIFFDRP